MAGKAYTMREMRAIVEYLTEHKAYGEIRGRKMWTEFANSQHTTRSWQSLKETFLKRILPDLHNPYYKLSVNEVHSFRAGYDVAEKERNNRLEFRTASEVSSSSANIQKQNEQSTAKKDNKPPTSNHGDEPSTMGIKNELQTTSIEEEVEKVTGEDITSAKIQSRNRSSADTVVLEYENAEEVQHVLESPKGDIDNGKTKSFKDLLAFEYTAPLTPIVRELLDDFETESEASDKESTLKVVKKPNVTENTKSKPMAVENTCSENLKANNDAESPIVIPDSEDANNEKNAEILEIAAEETTHIDVQDKNDEAQKSKPMTLEKSQKNIPDENMNGETNAHEVNKENNQQNNDITHAEPNETTVVNTDSNAADTEKNNKTSKNNNTINNMEHPTQNTGNTSSDTILPNNQEALDNSKKETHKTSLDKTENDAAEEEVTNAKRSEKRSASQESRENKKQKLSEKDNNTDEIEIHGRITPVIGLCTDAPNIDPETASKIEKHRGIPDTTIIEINSDTPATNDTEEHFNALQKNVSDNVSKPSTSTAIDISDDVNKSSTSIAKDVSIPTNEDKDIEIVEDKNPCLLSVSLFDEQFNKTKYSDSSDSDDEATQLPKQNRNKDKPQTETKATKDTEDKIQKESHKQKEVVVVKNDPKKQGILESSADCEPKRQATVNKVRQVDKKSVTLQRERALANVFGFANGHGASTSRKRLSSHRRRSHHQHRRQSKNNASNSSEWTSESDSECYISPPRGRRYRQTRKYLKPKSSRILQDPDEGMLYVVFGKNIYPLVKDGKHIKNFLTYRPDSGSDMEEESYWRQKYVEEKKRVGEIKKLLKETIENDVQQTNDPAPPKMTSTSRSPTTTHPPQKPVQDESAKHVAAADAATVENKEVKDDKMVLKMASKNGVEFCLEGGWNQISNAMPQMVKMLQSESTVPNNGKSKALSKNTVVASREELMELSSGISTPVIATLVVDPEVHEKVNKIETEIFKEIEEQEKEEQVVQIEPENPNVTKRKTRARKESSSSNATSISPPKRTRLSKKSVTEPNQETSKPVQSKRASKQLLEVPNELAEPKQDETEKPSTRSMKTSEQQTVATEEKDLKTNVVEKQQNDAVDQKLPARRQSLRLSKQKDTSDNNSLARSDISPLATRSSSRLTKAPIKYDTDSSATDIRSRLRNSTSQESTALTGFDTQEARYMFPPAPKTKISPKGKKTRSLAKVNIIPTQENIPGNSIDNSQGYQDSDISPMKIQLPKRKRKLSLMTQRKYKNSRVTRRNSYPMLMQELSSDSNNSSYFIPIRKSQSTLDSNVYKSESYQLLLPKQRASFNNLAPIDETGLATREYDSNIRHFNSIDKEPDKSINDMSNIIVEIGSSSNVSLPLSPELSVVENLSISKEMIQTENHPSINEIQQLNGNSNIMDFSEYMISNLDISIPLMDQQCDLQRSIQKENNAQKLNRFSDPLLNKVCTVNVENLTLSESLDQRLRNLLLESQKKTRPDHDKENAMEVDETRVVTAKKTRAANKKQTAIEVDEAKPATTKAKPKKRSSTPQKKKTAKKMKEPKNPVIEEEHIESCSFGGRKSCPPVITVIPPDENANNCADVTIRPKKVESKKMKKDVIKVKIQRPKRNTRSSEKLRGLSSGTSSTSTYTDSGINEVGTFSGLHLKGNDDSVDLIHNHSETCLLANQCIDDSLEFIENSKSIISVNSSIRSADNVMEIFFDEGANIISEELCRNSVTSEPRIPKDNGEYAKTVFHSPPTGNSSLITEDLSDVSPPPTNWYLFSEDDTNTMPATNTGGYGANLKQIFPVICTVPELSTISEMSKENGDSMKSNFDNDGDEGSSNFFF